MAKNRSGKSRGGRNKALSDWEKLQQAANEQAAKVQKLRDAHTADIQAAVPAKQEGPLKSLNKLGLKLLKAHCSSTKGNTALFPSSIHPVVAMLHAAAKGSTAREITKAFGIKSSQAWQDGYASLLAAMRGNKDFELDIHNHVWIKEGLELLSEYVEVLEKYQTGFDSLDFTKAQAAAEAINEWADRCTKGMIKKIATPDLFSEATRTVLGNAVRFKGQWIKPFDKQCTYPLPFKPDGSQEVQAPTMTLKKEPVRIFTIKGFSGIDLPMKGASVLLLKPNDGLTLDKAIAGLPADALEKIDAQLRDSDIHSLDLYVPKFKIETDAYDLVGPCNTAGVSQLFSRGADLSGMLKVKDELYVSSMLHKAVIEVDEEGATGAAVTIAVVSATSVAWPPQEFRLDRSFLAIVRDRSKAPIAFAKVVNPVA